MNLQNQPERSHPMFIADEGYSVGYFDMSQAEARIVAFYADIATWKEQFERARFDGATTHIGLWRPRCSMFLTTRFPPMIVKYGMTALMV